ncbi:23S ribosomal RNA methyltransferase Erm [Agromyces luteolus]|uniref:23S ribosomal RNA methyltransferase Erm n=2 Tax=Agromyces luteolus TaxID=88373 RepID=A0A7C9HLD8_9MICO|nr:23S ribosomal RNA methyltransferase Erm [Agromyces luteolus]
MTALVATTPGPIVELGAGGGALTRALARLDRPLTAVELDPRRAAALRRELGGTATVVQADVLRWPLPREPFVLVGNVPFHLTTAILRRILDADRWRSAILLTQWEVARRRCGVGGASMLTVQSAPWYRFTLDRRVPARAFRPVPSVDGGVFRIDRRPEPLARTPERRAYRAWVGDVFQGPGRGLVQVLGRTSRPITAGAARRMLRDRGIAADTPPSRLTTDDWLELWGLARGRA